MLHWSWGRHVLVAAALVCTAACGSDDSADETDGGDDAATTAVPLDAPDDAGTAATSSPADGSSPGSAPTAGIADADIDPDGELRIATLASIFWDPVKSPSSFTITYLGLVYDRLVHTAPDGSLIPGLAEAWSYSDDGLTLTFELREGVTFQDGTPFDAAAVLANLERAQTLEDSVIAPELQRVAEVVAVDDLTVELTLSSPDATLPAVFADRAGAMVSPAAMNDPELDHHPVGTGMFTLADFKPGASFRLERWDDYWDPAAAQLAAIDVQILPDAAARVNALVSGQVDLAPIEPADVERVEETEGVEVLVGDTTRFVYLDLNRGQPPLDDVRVRQAISHAIDRESIVEGPWFGFGTPALQPFPAGYFPHVEGLDDTYPYDPERAKELLDEAGYADGFSLEVIVVPTPAAYQQLGAVLQAQLAEVGIDMQIRLTDASALGQDYYVDKVAPAALLFTNGRSDPALTIGDRYAATGFFNTGATSTPRLEELYAAALESTDLAERTELLQDASVEIVEQALDTVLFFAQEPLGISDRVVGYEHYLSGKPEYRGVGVSSS